MTQTQEQIEEKALAYINKKLVKVGLPEIDMEEYVASIRSTKIQDEYRAAMVDEAMEQAEDDLGVKEKK